MIIKLLSPLNKKQRKTITPDRDPEFAKYKYFSRACGIDCYFANLWSPWQRGTNENMNGLIREYLPKRTDMTPVSEEYIETVIHKLNYRPRKYLGWRTPYEVFTKINTKINKLKKKKKTVSFINEYISNIMSNAIHQTNKPIVFPKLFPFVFSLFSTTGIVASD